VAERPWLALPDGVEIRVRATPRGGRDSLDEVEALADGRAVLRVRVRAAPEDGAANEAVRRLLAKALRLPASSLTLRSGAAARIKTLVAAGDPATLAAALETLCGPNAQASSPWETS
jgi:uncharacterized protein YggU (UPF0235/DUF167 family)